MKKNHIIYLLIFLLIFWGLLNCQKKSTDESNGSTNTFILSGTVRIGGMLSQGEKVTLKFVQSTGSILDYGIYDRTDSQGKYKVTAGDGLFGMRYLVKCRDKTYDGTTQAGNYTQNFEF